MTRWTDTLPEVGAQADPRRHGEIALSCLVYALQDERKGRRDMLLRDVRHAAAHVRTWRLSLPKDQKWKRNEDFPATARDRYLIRSAARAILNADGYAPDRDFYLRAAEAALRTLGRRLQAEVSAEPARTAGQETAETLDGDVRAVIHCAGCTCPIERDTADILARWERERVAAMIAQGIEDLHGQVPRPGPLLRMWVSGAKWAASVAETGNVKGGSKVIASAMQAEDQEAALKALRAWTRVEAEDRELT